MDDPTPSQDIAVMDWIVDWDLPGLGRFFEGVSFLTGVKAGLIYGSLGIAALLLLGKNRPAIVFGAIGLTIGLIAVLGDYTLGELVDRSRPLSDADNSTPAFPSGHVFGSTVFFGFVGFVALYYRLESKVLVPLLVVLGALVILTGPARIFVQAHFPSDVAAGYLLAAIWLMVVIPAVVFLRNTKWMSSRRIGQNAVVIASESCKVVGSIASVVVLDPEEGTATKVYTPPPLVRILYWIAFQAKFPYETNTAALESGKYRRQIASLLTIHRFGKDLVSPVTTIDCGHGSCSFVTEFIPGELAKNDEPAQKFLGEVSESFAEAGLSVWQVNPRNPHAHTNLIHTPEGDYKIIDLESAVVTLLPAPGQFRSSLKSGNLPIFDDIDFPRLRNFATDNEAALEASLGTKGLAELRHATDHAEQSINDWKNAEPRIWGHIVSRIYKLLNWKAYLQHLMGALSGADRAAEAFLAGGVDRWENEGRITPQGAAELRARLASGDVQEATRHLGAHLVLSVALAIPIPGVRSLARFLWTLTFWAKSQLKRLRRGGGVAPERAPNIHTPLVMVLALIPAVGGVAYFASRPLRNKPLIQLILDQAAWKLPFSLYRRWRLGRRLAPPVQLQDATLPSQVLADDSPT
jgi:undecaprenyl-diphosphatase